MIPAKYPIVVYRGATFDISISSRDAQKVPISLEKYTSSILKVSPPWKHTHKRVTPAPIYEMSSYTNNIIITPDFLAVTLHLSADETEDLEFDEARYVLYMIVEVTGEETIVDKMLVGKFSVLGDDDI